MTDRPLKYGELDMPYWTDPDGWLLDDLGILAVLVTPDGQPVLAVSTMVLARLGRMFTETAEAQKGREDEKRT